MNLATRRWLYLTFILSFFIITPLVIIYANGYQLNFSNRILIKTGTMALETSPAGATISINGQQQKTIGDRLRFLNRYQTTPAKITNLLPGTYNIALSLDGYWPWQKQLVIQPGQTTFAEDIVLFKKDQANLIEETSQAQIIPSPNTEIMPLKSAAGLSVYYLNREITGPGNLVATSSIDNITWSSDQKKVLINNVLYNLANNAEPINLEAFIGQHDGKLVFGRYNQTIIYIKENQLLEYNLSNGTVSIIYQLPSDQKEKIIDVQYQANQIFISLFGLGGSSISILDERTGKIVETLPTPEALALTIHNITINYIALLNSKANKLYLLNRSDRLVKTISLAGFLNGVWVAKNQLLYWNANEIYLFDAANNQKRLLTRISQPITSVVWHPSKNYIVYATTHQVNSLELDERDRHNTITLLTTEKITGLAINPTGDSLYVSGTINQVDGLFRLALN
ncbi:MAG: PEGA domain-containing protein [Candidatus Falkowbacteria bacterium]